MEFYLATLLSCLNVPYLWGGTNPLVGLDCSGLARWVLKSAGANPPGELGSQGLCDFFANNGNVNTTQKLGSLIFYGKSILQIEHVDVAVSPYQVIGAIGGDSTCTSIEIAKAKGACVKMRHNLYRGDRQLLVYPNYAKIGMSN